MYFPEACLVNSGIRNFVRRKNQYFGIESIICHVFKIFVQTESIVLNHRAIYVDKYIHKVKKKNKIQAR